MGVALLIAGLLIWLLVSPLVGLILVIIGIALIFIPGAPYGYSSWRGRRGTP